MVVYGLCTHTSSKTLTLYSIGEQNEVPKTGQGPDYVTTYYSDINKAKSNYRQSERYLSPEGYTCVDET